MRAIIFALICLFNLLIFYSLEFQISQAPPIGKFFSPFHGFWQNAKEHSHKSNKPLKVDGFNGTAQVIFDERMVPHIFAENNTQLVYTQGYVTAYLRLWQMEMLTNVASGRLSEFLGESERILELDRYYRRIGLKLGAERTVEVLNIDTEMNELATAYANGVNEFISGMTYKNLPLEYKLMNFEPEKWSTLKTALLLKLMANDLTGKDDDLEHTNALKLFGKAAFTKMYPNYYDFQVPIVPKGVYNGQDRKFNNSDEDSIISSGAPLFRAYPGNNNFKPIEGLGSNNWALSGSKTVNGNPILCSDPHLGLKLPSIWLEMHLNNPQTNCYGVALPGAPGIIIGFNDNIAWGMTNASLEVRDWYLLEVNDDMTAYKLDGEWLPFEMVVETIKVKGKADILDTIYHTKHGPVVYDHNFKGDGDGIYALRWTAHNGENEMRAIAELNKARNYEDYMNALDHYSCPGQNFVFASKNGNIAIRTQGKFPLRQENEGRIVRDGTKSSEIWDEYIPFRENPHVKNPERQYVSSANQHPTDTTYPYHYVGYFEYFRNTRINSVLDEEKKFSVDDLKALQLDNKNLIAEKALPYLLRYLDTTGTKPEYHQYIEELKGWNYFNEREFLAPSLFEEWWLNFKQLTWDEVYKSEVVLRKPSHISTIYLLQNMPFDEFFDDKSTTEIETAKEIAVRSFEAAMSKGDFEDWGDHKATLVEHTAKIAALSRPVYTSGNVNIVNATGSEWGPSWRMVVELSDSTHAWGVYPGGQSGNPGSKYYDNFLNDWVEGNYYPLYWTGNPEFHENRMLFKITLKGNDQ